jgi:aspartyl protease family protein
LSEQFASSDGSRPSVLERDWDGHYLAEAEVNGVPVTLMVDTGATMVLIPYEQAAAIGLKVDTLDFSMPVTTANGSTMVAPFQISSIRIQHVAVFDIPGAVAQPGRLKTGLLGMSFLEQLGEASVQGNRMILRQTRPEVGVGESSATTEN